MTIEDAFVAVPTFCRLEFDDTVPVSPHHLLRVTSIRKILKICLAARDWGLQICYVLKQLRPWCIGRSLHFCHRSVGSDMRFRMLLFSPGGESYKLKTSGRTQFMLGRQTERMSSTRNHTWTTKIPRLGFDCHFKSLVFRSDRWLESALVEMLNENGCASTMIADHFYFLRIQNEQDISLRLE